MRNILLHTCCAPCLTVCVKVLRGTLPWEKSLERAPNFDEVTVYFYNPNIHPQEEYHKRAMQTKKYADRVECPFIEGEYIPENWHSKIKGLETEPEKGHRCTVCYAMRLEQSFLYARMHGYHAIASSLTLSPYKDAERVNVIGRYLSETMDIEYISSNFKKNNGYRLAQQISKEECIYCQNYCGCAFSLADRQRKES